MNIANMTILRFMMKAMKKLAVAFLLLIFSCSLSDLITPQYPVFDPVPYDPGAYGWTMVWSDEFDGTNVNPANWNFDIGTNVNGWGNNELQFYTSNSQNVSVANGVLSIRALAETNYGTAYTSARLHTQGLHSWTYGKIAARIRFPHGQGILPMFWMLGNSYNGFNWPDCGEMVVAEMFGGAGASNRTVYSGIYWNKFGVTTEFRDFLDTGVVLHNAYHVFEIEWESNALVSRFDGRPYFSYPTTSLDCAVFQNAFFLILSLAVGGNWAGSPDGSTVFPQAMEVDWIRVYRKSVSVPVAHITYPQDGTTVYGCFPVMGVSSGNNGIQNTYLSVDHSAFIPLNDPTNWSSNLSLSAGPHNLKVYTVDCSNQTSATSEMTVTVTWEKPVVTFTYVPGYTNNEMIHGTVRGVSPSLYKISLWLWAYFNWWPKPYYPAPYTAIRNDGSWSTIYNTGGVDGWADNFVAYLIPSYTPVFPGTDIHGSISNYIIVHGAFNRGDSNAPADVHFISPTNGQTIVGRFHTFSFSGSVSDDIGGGTIHVSVNGAPYSANFLPMDVFNNHYTNWCVDEILIDGYNSLSFYALDDGYRSSPTNQLTVIFVNDETPPALTVTSPLQNGRYPWPGSVTVSGTAADANGVRAVYLQVDNTGYFQANGTNSWNITWPFLDSGMHTLRVYAEDIVTNTSSTNTTVFFVD